MSRLDPQVHEANRQAMVTFTKERAAQSAYESHQHQISMWLRSRPEVGVTATAFYQIDPSTRETVNVPAFS